MGMTLKESAIALQENVFIHTFMWFIVLDIFTGLAKALKTKELNSSIGRDGLIRHILIIFIVALCSIYLPVYDFAAIARWITFYFIVIYFLSLVENTDAIGIPLPTWLKEHVLTIKKRMDQKYKFTDVQSMDIKIEQKKE